MTIRDAGEADLAALDGMLARLAQWERQWDPNLDTDRSTAGNYAPLLGREDCKLLVAEEEGVPVGYLFGLVYHQPGHRRPIAILDALYVSPEYRGRGCAKALIEAFTGFAREMGAGYVELKVLAGNHRAAGLYEHMGFRDLSRQMRLEL